MNSSTQLPIGVFDSGIGGLTVVRQIRRVLPHEDLVYLGDTARVPYGTKSPGTVVRFACEDMLFLVRQRVKAVVVACNTVSAWALPTLEQQFAVPIFGVVTPGAQAALEKTRHGRIGVIGTTTTIRSQAYSRAILARDGAARVFSRACPLLVPLVEEGWTDQVVTRTILRTYLAPLLRQGIDTLVLGCTHYPLLKKAIRTVAGPDVALVDSAETCARYLGEQLQSANLLNQFRRRRGAIRPFVTDEVERFDELAKRFLGVPTEPARKVDLPAVTESGWALPARNRAMPPGRRPALRWECQDAPALSRADSS
jgi:glutamate racemase